MKKRRWNKKFLACVAVLGFGYMMTGWHSECEVPMEVLHTVKPQETLWGICEAYHEQEAGNLYMLEFKEEIIEKNPWLKEQQGQLQPGDVLHIPCHHKKSAPAASGADSMK